VARHLARIMIEGLILPTKATTDYFRIARYMPRICPERLCLKTHFAQKLLCLPKNRSAQHDFRVLGFSPSRGRTLGIGFRSKSEACSATPKSWTLAAFT